MIKCNNICIFFNIEASCNFENINDLNILMSSVCVIYE